MLGGYFAALASVPFLGYGWQFLHGSSIVFAGWRIPVPAGFYMTQSEKSRTLWRLSIGMPIRKGPYGQITLFHQSKPVSGREFDRDLEAGFVRAAQIEGYALSAKRELRVADTRAVCFEFTRFGETGLRRALCRRKWRRVAVVYRDAEVRSRFLCHARRNDPRTLSPAMLGN
jgi:hypothetical protein